MSKGKYKDIYNLRKYHARWEEKHPWLRKKVEDEIDYAFCTVCNISILPKISDIIRHSKSQRHKKRSAQDKSSTTIEKVLLSKSSFRIGDQNDGPWIKLTSHSANSEGQAVKGPPEKTVVLNHQGTQRKTMAETYEYYELVTYDIHGNQKGQMVAKRRLDGVMKYGLGIYTAVNYFGIQDTPNVHPDFGENTNYGNLNMKPVMSTLTKVIKSAGSDGRVGHLICDLEYLDGTKDITSPRTVAELQVAKLAELQPEIKIKSASEVEFDIRLDDAYGGKDFGHTANWCSINILEDHQGLIMELLDELKEVKVNVDSFQTEAGPGQFEATIDVTEGIKGPDSTLRFKNATKTFFRKRGMFATYMTKPDPEKIASGMHFNHSLWTKAGRSVFIDHEQPNHLSVYGQYWIAGLIAHAPALTALCCPTVNCYRRIGKPWAPMWSNWGVQDRTSTFRLKVEGQGHNVYVENRLPSSASNPYLVMACTIAAGLDGITKEMQLPAPGQQDIPLPQDLGSALFALETNEVMIQCLGQAFVKHFVYCKRAFEVEMFGAWREDSETHRKEYDVYFHKS